MGVVISFYTLYDEGECECINLNAALQIIGRVILTKEIYILVL